MTPASLKSARQQLGLTQAAFAKSVGVTRLTVIRWEQGSHPISETVALLVARLLADHAPGVKLEKIRKRAKKTA